MFWDGFDRPLREGHFSRNLWDNLRELAMQSSLILVTASRQKLRDLICDGDSVTSEFWRIFEVVRLKTLNEKVIQAFIAHAADLDFSPGGLTELNNWTGGIPVDPSSRLSILQLLTGSHDAFTSAKARFVGKDTHVLLNALHSFRNRNQHAGGEVFNPNVETRCGKGFLNFLLPICFEKL